MRPGWLLYAGDMGLITADVLDADMSMQTSTLDVTSVFSSARQLVRGTTEITFKAQLDEKNMHWDQDVTGGEPPNLAALLALARHHPDEYRQWCEGEAVLKALGG